MLRFRKLINEETLLKLYKAFILPHFYYCSSVWHSCGARNADKVDNLNKRILRFILQDYSSPYDILLSKVNMKSLFIRRLQNFMITLYKSLFFMNYPGYLKDMFTLRSSSQQSCSHCKIKIKQIAVLSLSLFTNYTLIASGDSSNVYYNRGLDV